jgi:two-component system chemotaxis response regulator CheY
MRALIVDDSNFLRQFMRQTLESFGWNCTEAGNGSDALTVLAARPEPFDVMLVDVNMPVMNGLECVRQTRERRLAPNTKIMMVTTEADNSFIRKALDYGADEFLMKPFSPQSLREKLALLDWEG